MITATRKERSAGSSGARGGKRADPGRAERATEEVKEQRPDGVGKDSRKNASCETETVPVPHPRAAQRVKWGDEQRGELARSPEEQCTGWARVGPPLGPLAPCWVAHDHSYFNKVLSVTLRPNDLF